ncbi:hypothetical protein GIX45_16685 [Erwinia sp. CPCC 100877]|nr:hypothetical protein [Erwinia sp. CPCC 100877]
MKKNIFRPLFLIILGACAAIEINSKSLLTEHISSGKPVFRQISNWLPALSTTEVESKFNDYSELNQKLNLVKNKVQEEYDGSYLSEIKIYPKENIFFFEINLIQENMEYELSARSDTNELILEEIDESNDYYLEENPSFLPSKMIGLSEVLDEASSHVQNLSIEEIEFERNQNMVLWTIHTKNDLEIMVDGVSGTFLRKHAAD